MVKTKIFSARYQKTLAIDFCKKMLSIAQEFFLEPQVALQISAREISIYFTFFFKNSYHCHLTKQNKNSRARKR
jgi:hypothetical protein